MRSFGNFLASCAEKKYSIILEQWKWMKVWAISQNNPEISRLTSEIGILVLTASTIERSISAIAIPVERRSKLAHKKKRNRHHAQR